MRKSTDLMDQNGVTWTGYDYAIAPSVAGGSESTKRDGIAVGYFKVQTKMYGTLCWTILDRLISSFVTIQHGANDGPMAEWKLGSDWGGMRIVKVTDLRPQATPEFMLDKQA